jgi:hypothetical protein
VPVNISCIQDQPDYVFHITAYNSQVDKILDVRLTQPGMSLVLLELSFYSCVYRYSSQRVVVIDLVIDRRCRRRSHLIIKDLARGVRNL